MENKIPEISDRQLNKMLKVIKPVVRFELEDWETGKIKLDKEGEPKRASTGTTWWGLFDIEPVDPRGIAYTWEPKPVGKWRHDISCFDIIRTYHRCGHPSLFKPSIAEVLAQIPKDIVDKTIAFEILNHHDMDSSHCVSDGNYHAVLTRLFMDSVQWQEESLASFYKREK